MIRFYFILFIVAVSAKTYVTTTEAPKECGDNASWNTCANPCQQRSCDSNVTLPRPTCPDICVAQCTCNSGYVQGPGGKCILEKDCPPPYCSDPNAVWSECASACNQHSCDESDEPSACAAVCLRQCTCKPGYVTGPDGNCISKEDCPPKNNCSDPNAFWNDCGSGCEPQCVEHSEPRGCAAVCVPKCSCKKGYVIGPDGKCVAKEDCPPKNNCSDPNAFWNECGSGCEPQCVEPSEPRSCAAVCVQKCSCKKGYVIGPDGRCVAKEDCPPKNNCSDPNAFWNECGSGCEPLCKEPSDPRVCPAVCVPKCSCKKGYVIGPDGKCVAKEDCPPKNNCSDPNAFWNDCGSDCEKQCHEPSDPRICPAVCVPKCSCKKGYVIGPDGKCVAKEDCPPKNNCSDPNAFWNECGSGCEPLCKEPSDPRVCPAVCVPKCSCKKGYVIGPAGKCVAKEDCPPKNNCSDPNAFWNDCGSDCEKQCHEPSDPRICPAVCVPKCSCKKGYVIGPDGKCVAKEDCPPKNNCSDPNAFWNECGSGCEPLCKEPSDPRVCPAVCVPKCSCKKGYVIGPDGKCVAKEDCPPKNNCSDPNAFWNDCGSDCEKQCHEPSDPRICPAVCVQKCSCKKGYVIGPDGKCVAKEDCPPKNNCSDPNAFWNECGSGCEPLCKEPSDPRVCPAVCVPKCSCKKGYVIGPDGKCVAKEDCPPKNNCSDPNAFWNECGSGCEPLCKEPSDPRVCPAVCVPKCSCKKGYVIGPDGKCVAKEDCPPKNNCSDPNAFWNECGSGCEPLCKEPSDPRVCPDVCVPKCSCKKGYVIGPDGKCTLKKDCPPIVKCLGPNEVWNDCGSDCEKQCHEPSEPMVCPAVCVPKCSCKPGHVRGPHGKCVAKEDCPPKNNCSDPNAVWNTCARPCDQPSCDEPDVPIKCASLLCLQQCTCKPGYVTGPDGKCILKKDCPKKKCADPNEVWTDCGTSCEEGCEKRKPGTVCAAVCISKCSCKRGLVRGPDGKCIAKKDCPKKCGRNQFWNKCGSDCEARCDKSHEHRVCPEICLHKCSCKPGYVIADNGDCVKEEDCDTTCE